MEELSVQHGIQYEGVHEKKCAAFITADRELNQHPTENL
jgi:hypothetical protein